MQSPFSVILRTVNREPGGRLNVLCVDSHAEYLSRVAKAGHMFFGFRFPTPRLWDSSKLAYPWNYQPLRTVQPPEQFRPDMTFDIILAQDRGGEYQNMYPLARSLTCPLILVEHNFPNPRLDPATHRAYLGARGRWNVFDSEALANAWGWDAQDPSRVIIDPAGPEQEFVKQWARLFEEAL